jgi:hypothetical protein
MGEQDIPNVSVIVRAHDPEQFKTLTKAIRSVHDQRGLAQIEISLETSNFPDPLLLQDFVEKPNRRVRLSHYNMPHLGDSRVGLMRHGVRAAKAPFLTFLDFDDTLHPTGLMQLHDSLLSTAGAKIAIGNIDLVHTDAGGKVQRVPYHSARPSLVSMLQRNSVPIHSYMIRTDVARRAIARVPALTLYEDYAFLLAAMEEGHITFTQPFKPVGVYNIAGNQSEKYAETSDFSWHVIQDFARTLQVPIPVSELKETGPGATSQRSLNAMIDAMPSIKATHVKALVETVPITPEIPQGSQNHVATRPLIVTGWICNSQDPEQIIWGVYALTSRGNYVHISTRSDRPDVAAHLNVKNGPYGFSDVIDANEIAAVYAILGTRKKKLPIPVA